MSILGLRMMNTPAVVLDPLAPAPASAGAMAAPLGRIGSRADFEAGMEQAAADAAAADGPPLWDVEALARALARRAEPGGPDDAPLGNPHPHASDEWFAYGKETGVWFQIHHSWPGYFERHITTAEILGMDTSEEQAAWHRFLLDYATQLARLSDLMSRAARAGASDAQLRKLVEAAMEEGSIGKGEKGDFKKAWKSGDSELRLGNIHGGSTMVFGGDGEGHMLELGARHQVRRMGDHAVDAMEKQAQEMGLDLFESDDRKAERASAALGLFFKQHQLELAHLHARDPAAWARLHERRRELVAAVEEGADDALSEDPEAAMRRANGG